MSTSLVILLQRFGYYSRVVAADLRKAINLLTYNHSLTFPIKRCFSHIESRKLFKEIPLKCDQNIITLLEIGDTLKVRSLSYICKRLKNRFLVEKTAKRQNFQNSL